MSNSTSLMSPSDIIMMVPRMMARAGSFAFVTVPERIDSMFFRHGSMIAEATGNGTWNMITAALSSDLTADTTLSAAAAVETTTTSNPARPFSLSHLGQVRNFGGIFTYMTSKWALACFTLVGSQLVASIKIGWLIRSSSPSSSTGPKSTRQHVVTSPCHGLYV